MNSPGRPSPAPHSRAPRQPMRRHHTLLAALVTLATLAVAAPPAAEAQQTGDDSDALTAEEKRELKSLLTSAREAYKNEEYDRAAHLLEAAYEIAPRPAFHYRLGLSYQNAGELEEARRHFRKYLDQKPDTPKRDEVERRLRELDSRIDDDTEAETAGRDATRDTDRAATTDAPSTDYGPGAAGWASIAVGGAGLLSTTIFGVLFQQADSEYDDIRSRSKSLSRAESNIDQVTSRRNGRLTGTIVSASVAALGTGAATYFLLTDRSPDSRRTARPTISPRVGSDIVGLQLDWTF